MKITASKHPTHHSYHPCMQLLANHSSKGSLKMLMHHGNTKAVLRMTMTLKQHHGFSLSVSGSVLTSKTCNWKGAFFGPRVFHGSPGHQTKVTCQLLRRCSGNSTEGVAPKVAEPALWSSGRSTPAQPGEGLQAAEGCWISVHKAVLGKKPQLVRQPSTRRPSEMLGDENSRWEAAEKNLGGRTRMKRVRG